MLKKFGTRMGAENGDKSRKIGRGRALKTRIKAKKIWTRMGAENEDKSRKIGRGWR